MRAIVIIAGALAMTPAVGQDRTDAQSIKVGPWTIATTYKGDKFEDCTMTGSTRDLGVVFTRNDDGLLLALDSPKWKLERGKAYDVHLAAGPHSVDAKALAESRAVTIALADKPFNERLRMANFLEVRGEGATLRVPLEGSAAGLDRLDQCFQKNTRDSADVNPFVAPARRP